MSLAPFVLNQASCLARKGGNGMPMCKRVVEPVSASMPYDHSIAEEWIDLASAARVEITSEDRQHPVEAALLSTGQGGWRAARPGEQTIRLIFDQPQHVKRIQLLFEEPSRARTQEFALHWSPDGGRSFKEIVRQQWNFSPTGSVREAEDYRVDLPGVTTLELAILPDISKEDARASLACWRVA
jgi:hypothetical protein